MPVGVKSKNMRLRPGDPLGRRLYFVTLCFNKRERVGSNPRVAAWLVERLRLHSANSGILIHAYCLMPDHVHILAQAADETGDLRAFVEYFKQDTGFRFQARTRRRLWQFKYYAHTVRSPEAAERIAWYMWMNPVRKGLCGAPQDYRFSGWFTDLGMKILRGPAPKPWSPPWKTEASL
jgi:putative transposase